MEALEAIHGRRSIRRYTAEPVTDEQLEPLLRAAMAAPSAGNQQSWRFVVVRDHMLKVRLSKATPYSAMIENAGVAIVIAGDTRDEKHPGYWVQDCSAAIQNLLVAAHAKGLGAVWIGVHPIAERERNVAEAVELPAGVVAMAMIALGHPEETKEPVDRFDPGKVYVDRWQG